MNLEKAIEVRDRIAAFLYADGVKRRVPRPRVAIGLAPGIGTPFQIAIRSPSVKDLERALGQGAFAAVNEMAFGEVDSQVIGQISADPASDYGSPSKLAIGASVGHYKSTAGSLGFFAQRGESVGFVSNNHVLADCDRGRNDDDVLQPGPADRGDRSSDVVARLAGDYPKLHTSGPVVDAAFARLRGDVPPDAGRIAPGLTLQPAPVPLFEQREVLKYGRTTGLTRGRITAFALLNVFVGYPSLRKPVVFNRQIEIQSADDRDFSKPGDSGSLVVNPEGHPVGLLFARSGDGRYSYANPIGDVLSELGVQFLS